MTLDQFQSLRMWHLRHWQQHPVEKHTWEGVLTLWMSGWVGGPAALVLDLPWSGPLRWHCSACQAST